MADDLLILFPGALGDFVCFWPALQALRERHHGRVAVVARAALLDLLPPERFIRLSIDRREVADLFATGALGDSTRQLFSGFARTHSWTGFGNPSFAHRLQAATSGTIFVHPFRGMRPGEHAAQYFARCTDITPREQAFVTNPAAACWARDLWAAHGLGRHTLVIHPGSGSRQKNWEGMGAITDWWLQQPRGRVLTVIGPAENDRAAPTPGNIPICREPLDRVAALLQRAPRYLGNDSGISQLAGLVAAPGLALFGPSDPSAWRPLGGTLRVLAAPDPCAACGPHRFCVHRLPIETVRTALLELDAAEP